MANEVRSLVSGCSFLHLSKTPRSTFEPYVVNLTDKEEDGSSNYLRIYNFLADKIGKRSFSDAARLCGVKSH